MKNGGKIDVNDPEHVDHVLEELWKIREEFAAQFNHDVDAMGRYLMEQERLHPERMSTRLPQKARPRASGIARSDS
jgi:hypothetical protein